MGALTNFDEKEYVPGMFGKYNGVILEFDGSTSYATNGDTGLGATRCRFKSTPKIIMFTNTKGYTLDYDYTNEKVKFFRTAAHRHDILIKGGQAAGVALQIDVDTAAGIIGKTTATDRTLTDTTNNIQNSTQVALAEVSNAVDLSSLADFRALCIGA